MKQKLTETKKIHSDIFLMRAVPFLYNNNTRKCLSARFDRSPVAPFLRKDHHVI